MRFLLIACFSVLVASNVSANYNFRLPLRLGGLLGGNSMNGLQGGMGGQQGSFGGMGGQQGGMNGQQGGSGGMGGQQGLYGGIGGQQGGVLVDKEDLQAKMDFPVSAFKDYLVF
ncbi:hypothetical protein SSS_10342 [Sarcoptes scabiei]|nr:hypothetical protein SSS_10342 [Sarcoptes scabiei]